jgi:hypothetical protein
MPDLLALAQVFKIAAGLAQVALALWVLAAGRRTWMNIAFALSFGANGIAYAVFNLARPGTRTPGSFALEGRGLFNWIAVAAMVAFASAVILATERRRPIQWLAPFALGVPGMLTATTNGQAEHIDLLAFGGTIIYPTTAFALGALAAVFATTTSASLRSYCGLVSAALVINSVDHLGAGLGAGLVAPTTTSSVELTTMTILLAFWLWRAWQDRSRIAVLIVVCMVAPFVAGVLVRLAVGSYLAVQQSGFIGVGRFAAVAVLALGRGVFASSFHNRQRRRGPANPLAG